MKVFSLEVLALLGLGIGLGFMASGDDKPPALGDPSPKAKAKAKAPYNHGRHIPPYMAPVNNPYNRPPRGESGLVGARDSPHPRKRVRFSDDMPSEGTLFVRSPSGQTYRISVKSNTTIRDVKERIKTKFGLAYSRGVYLRHAGISLHGSELARRYIDQTVTFSTD